MKKFHIGLIVGLIAGLLISSASIALGNAPIKLIINGNEVQCDVPPQNIDGRVMVPARYVAEGLGATVQWDNENQIVVINGAGYVDTAFTKAQALNFINRWGPIATTCVSTLADTSATDAQIKTAANNCATLIGDLNTWYEPECYTPLKNALKKQLICLSALMIIRDNIDPNNDSSKLIGYGAISKGMPELDGLTNDIKIEVTRLKNGGKL